MFIFGVAVETCFADLRVVSRQTLSLFRMPSAIMNVLHITFIAWNILGGKKMNEYKGHMQSYLSSLKVLVEC